MPHDQDDVLIALRANWDAQRQAMVDGDAAALAELLTDDFTLRHMTGYEQTRTEWLQDVDSGDMTYHAMQVVAVATDAGPLTASSSSAPLLIARTQTTATIWGSHGTWPLQLHITYAVDGAGWLAQRTVASTWR